MVDKVGQSLIVPQVGMTFESEDKAVDMYNTYAGIIGFSLRKSHSKLRGDKTISNKYIVCSNEGHRENETSSKDGLQCSCSISVSREGIWTVQKVVLDHNHYLACPNKRHKLRSQ